MNRPKYLKGECQHCRGNLEFPVELIGTTTSCPHCQQETELMLPRPPEEPAFSRKALVLTLAAIFIMIGALVATMLGLRHYQKLLANKRAVANAQSPPMTAPAILQSNAPPAAVPEAGTVQSDFQISPVTLEKAPGTSLVYAVGTVKNLRDKQRFGVKVELDLLDASGQKVGSAHDYQQVLEPNGEWRFKAMLIEDKKASTAVLASITEQP
jgi:hypothetical protein